MSGSDAKALSVVDALVKATVRSVLFPGLKGAKSSPSRAAAAWVVKTPAVGTAAHDPQQDTADKPDSPFVVGNHFAHVLSYASWSDAQLTEEKRRLLQCLKIQNQKLSQEVTFPEQDEEESVLKSGNGGQTKQQLEDFEAAVLEAYALLTLFQNERALANVEVVDTPPQSHKLLHAQLDLYAKYFERTQRRKIQHEVDVLPIQKVYQNFVQSTPSGTFSSTNSGATA